MSSSEVDLSDDLPIAVDAMGSDLGPAEVVAGVALALKHFSDLGSIILVGDKVILKTLADAEGISSHKKLYFHHAPEVIGMDEKPIQSLKQKRNSSMVQALDLVKSGSAKAVLSSGNTGSLMAGGTIKLRTLEGVERPALGSIIPNPNSIDDNFVLIDAGANPEPSAKHLVHNAILGSNYAKITLNNPRPRVGLLTIGTEEGKGTELTNEAHQMLKQLNGVIDYQGLIEGFNVFDSLVDVVVCDGFTGNVLLKTCESLLQSLTGYLKKEITKTPIRKLGALLSKQAFVNMKDRLSPEKSGGAPLLGLNGLVMKTHGSSTRYSTMYALGAIQNLLKNEMKEHDLKDILQANEVLENQLVEV